MGKVAFMTSRASHVIQVEPGMVKLVSVPHSDTRELIEVSGDDIGENLVIACRQAKLTDGDIIAIASQLQITLPETSGIINTHDPRARANRFAPMYA